MNARLKPFALAGALLLGCSLGAFAQEVNMTLVGVNAGYVMGGVYTSPYQITVNGGAPMLLICDDFLTDIPTIPYSWSAIPTTLNAYQAGTNPAGTPKFSDVSLYATAAVLAAELLNVPSFYSEEAGELSYAIWGIFDPTLLSNNPGPGLLGNLTSAELTAAKKYLSDAEAVVAAATVNGKVDLSQLPTLTIYTPDPKSASQEFLTVSMPEPGAIGLLAIDLLGLSSLVLLARKYRTKASTN